MKISITNHRTNDGREYFRWEMFDGPDGSEHIAGFAIDLCEVFSKIIEWREKIAIDYIEEVLEDMKTLETFLQTKNETNS